MLESNNNEDFILEGLDSLDRKSIYSEKKDIFDFGTFIHENNFSPKFKGLSCRPTIFNTKTNTNKISNNAKLEQDEILNDFELVEDNNFIDKEMTNNENFNYKGYLDIGNVLHIEDPFMKASRPSEYNFRVTSNDINKIPNKTKKLIYKNNQKYLNKRSKSSVSENLNIDNFEKLKETNKEEETDEGLEENDSNRETFVDISRPSFISRSSIDFQENKFEIEILDSVWMTVLQVINCLIKSNLVQIAISMKELGLIWGPITIITIAIMSLVSLNLILEVNKITGQRSYLIFSEIIFGHFGSIIILLCQFMSAFGGCLTYVVIYNKVIPKLLTTSFSSETITDDVIFTLLLGFLLFLYCYKKDVSMIKSAAKYAVCAVILFFIVTIIDFIVAVSSQKRLISLHDKWNKKTKYEILYGLNRQGVENRLNNIISAIACIILSFSFHIFTFSIYGCMGKISRKQFFITTSISILIAAVIYLICGTIGYLLYYDKLIDSILDVIEDNWLSSLLSLANVINVVMTFPITFEALRNYFLIFSRIIITLFRNIFLYIFRCIPKIKNYEGRISNIRIIKSNNKKDINYFLMSGKPLVEISKIVEFFLTLILFISVFWFAFLYTKLKVIFSFAGGVMGNVLSFIFPSLFYLGVTDKKFSKYGIIAFIFIIFGFTTMGICIVSIIQTI